MPSPRRSRNPTSARTRLAAGIAAAWTVLAGPVSAAFAQSPAFDARLRIPLHSATSTPLTPSARLLAPAPPVSGAERAWLGALRPVRAGAQRECGAPCGLTSRVVLGLTMGLGGIMIAAAACGAADADCGEVAPAMIVLGSGSGVAMGAQTAGGRYAWLSTFTGATAGAVLVLGDWRSAGTAGEGCGLCLVFSRTP
jgi:hypothetical protein